MNNVKLLHIKCSFFQFFSSLVALKNNKKNLAPQEKSWNDAPGDLAIVAPVAVPVAVTCMRASFDDHVIPARGRQPASVTWPIRGKSLRVGTLIRILIDNGWKDLQAEPGTADPESGNGVCFQVCIASRLDGSEWRRLRAVRQMTLHSVAVYLHLPQSPHAVALYRHPSGSLQIKHPSSVMLSYATAMPPQ